MYKKTINCLSCEVKCDIIVRQTNYEDEIEVEYCPFCSTSIDDLEDNYSDEE
jgi:hypothetical protein